VDIRFLLPEARRFDEPGLELCACGIWLDERPVRGLAGLLDWRLGGRLSSLLASGFVRGELGETLLVPGRPHVPFEKVLVVGLGARSAFGDSSFRRATLRVARALEGMRVRRAAVELPGRGGNAIEPEHAVALMLECVGASPDHDAWWLVEDAGAQKRIEPQVRARRTAAARSW
jgi:hypothetical protein